MKISIVSAYYNRKQQLINTLNSIKRSLHNDYEMIVVDDCSDDEHRIESLVDEYPFLKVIRLEKHSKWYVNPCVPFNIGFSHVSGDIVLIQNPECFHYNDVISYVNDNLKENDYFSFACYSLSEEKTKNIDNYNDFNFNSKGAGFDGEDSWYNHSLYRPVGYHFASAIYNKKLKTLGGFDEEYALGLAYDDNELLYRVNKICDFKIVDNPLVLHQYHYNNSGNKILNAEELIEKNKNLYYNYTIK